MYLSPIEIRIFLKLQNLFVSNCKTYLSQIFNYICLKLSTIFVSNCQLYLWVSYCLLRRGLATTGLAVLKIPHTRLRMEPATAS